MSDIAAPAYWQHQPGGQLHQAIGAYFIGSRLDPAQIAVIRAYLREWIAHPIWREVEPLRASVDAIDTQAALQAWLDQAEAAGIDPL